MADKQDVDLDNLPWNLTPPTPKLTFLYRLVCYLQGAPLQSGSVPFPSSGMIRKPVRLGHGHFKGPRLSGKIIPGGGDWLLVEPDDTAHIDTRYNLETDDGAIICVQTTGIRCSKEGSDLDLHKLMNSEEKVDPNSYYFRIHAKLETGHPDYVWINRSVIVASAVRTKTSVIYDAYKVD